ncbi:MAG: methyltransferase domain-containing protein [Chloroflexi bacterium]|nr:methyltransferase domain-containing protein [Chloroflexota bacterium]
MSQSHEAIKQEVVGTYDRAAHLYGQVGTKQFTYFGNLLIERLNIPSGAHILDLASGRGALVFAAAEKVGESGHVVGIDLAPQMVALTQAEIERRGLTQASILLMDADNPAFESESFDFITCGFALHFLDYERILPKLRDLLKVGGIFATSIPNAPLSEAELARWGWLFELTKAVFPPDFTPPPAWIAPRRLKTPERAESALHAAGFSQVWTEQHDATLYFRDENDWWDWEWSQGSRFWVEGMSPDGLERFKRESFEHLRAMQTPQGIPMLDGALFAFARKS